MAEGMSFSFPSLLFHEGRTYGQPEVVPISLPQVATGLRSRLPGSFRRRGFQPDLLMPQEALFAREAHSMQAAMRRALLRRGRSGNAAFPKTESNVAGNLCRMCRKEESRHGDDFWSYGRWSRSGCKRREHHFSAFRSWMDSLLSKVRQCKAFTV